MKCLGTVWSIVCITATFTQQIVGPNGVSCLWDKSTLLFAQLPCQKYSGLVYSPVFQQKLGFWRELIYTYNIILKLNRNDSRPKRLGSVHHRNLSRPKSPVQNGPCYLRSYHALIIWIGLLSHSSAKRRVLARIYGKSEAVHTPLKM